MQPAVRGNIKQTSAFNHHNSSITLLSFEKDHLVCGSDPQTGEFKKCVDGAGENDGHLGH